MTEDPVVLVSGVRTAIGRFGGSLKDVDSHELGAACIAGALERAGVDPVEVDDVVMGQVGQVGPDAYNAQRRPTSDDNGDERQPPLLVGASGDPDGRSGDPD